jgi:hypothetical protein
MLVGGDRLNVAGVVPSLAAVDPRELSDDELASECLQATVLVHAVKAYAAALLVEFQQRGAWADDGAISAAAWVSNRTGTRRADLASLV